MDWIFLLPYQSGFVYALIQLKGLQGFALIRRGNENKILKFCKSELFSFICLWPKP